MAHQKLRLNLMANMFPLVSELWGRSIIVAGMDENYERTMVSPADISKDKGIPQAYYMHNCMPTPHGYQAVGYVQAIAGMLGSVDFLSAYPFQALSLNKYIYVPAAGLNYVYSASTGVWTSVSPITDGSVSDFTLITTAFLQGQTYFFIDGVGCFLYDDSDSNNPVFTEQTFIGVAQESVHGICAANGYMIIWTDTGIGWSSLVNVLDFTPSLITGAGSGQLVDAKGRINFALPVANGFIVYCDQNAVGAKYTANIDFPFAFYEIQGSGGCASLENVSYQANLGYHYAWTTYGLQQLDLSGSSASFVFPEVTAFLSDLVYEDFDEGTLTFTTTYLTTALRVKLHVVEDGYLVISYGINDTTNNYTYALIYDSNLGRWGKVKITHTDMFQWNSPNIFNVSTYASLGNTQYSDLFTTSYLDLLGQQFSPDPVRKTLAFLQENGTVEILNFDISEVTAAGVLLLGKYQFTRNNRILHQTSEVEVIEPANDFDLYILPTYDGKTFVAPLQGVLIPVPGQSATTAKTRKYGALIEGQNVSLLFKGAFNLTSVVSDFTTGGQI